MDVEERLTRLEQLVGEMHGALLGLTAQPGAPGAGAAPPRRPEVPGAPPGARGTPDDGPRTGPLRASAHSEVRSAGREPAGGAAAEDGGDRDKEEEAGAGHTLSAFLAGHRRDGRLMVFAGLGRWEEGQSGTATDVRIWDLDEGDRVSLDAHGARRLAGLCQALASEPRLAILHDLVHGERGTSELAGRTQLDRSQLYHHLRDLFLQGLVSQPERGRYRLTSRGLHVTLLATLLASSASETADFPPDDADGGAAEPAILAPLA